MIRCGVCRRTVNGHPANKTLVTQSVLLETNAGREIGNKCILRASSEPRLTVRVATAPMSKKQDCGGRDEVRDVRVLVRWIFRTWGRLLKDGGMIFAVDWVRRLESGAQKTLTRPKSAKMQRQKLWSGLEQI